MGPREAVLQYDVWDHRARTRVRVLLLTPIVFLMHKLKFETMCVREMKINTVQFTVEIRVVILLILRRPYDGKYANRVTTSVKRVFYSF